jgi:transposase
MYLVQLLEQSTGRMLLNYYEKQKVEGKYKAVFVERIGYLDEFIDLYEDPIAHFKEEAKGRTARAKATVEISFRERFTDDELSSGPGGTDGADRTINYGMLALSKIYHQLGIHSFVNDRRRYTKASFNHNHILQMLVYGRILFPGSKFNTWKNRGQLIGAMDFSEDDVYRSLPFFTKHRAALLQLLHRKVGEHYGRDTTLMYYDVTNYYWESDAEDGLRRRGVSKERRKTPIIQMGLLMDSAGLPVTYGLFAGNTNDSLTLSPMMGEVSEELEQGASVIYVADKGLMSGENRAEIIINRNGYVLSNSVRGKKITDATRKWILDPAGYVPSADGKSRYKSRIRPVWIWVEDRRAGKRTKVRINERQVSFWSYKYQQRSRHERARAIEKALASGSVLNNHGANKYFVKEALDPKSGEILTDAKISRYLDEDLIRAEEEMDGYYLICTNVEGTGAEDPPFKGTSRFKDNMLQLNRPVTTLDIIDMYRGLWKIEETFKITKSQLRARPVFVRKEEHIEAHFLTCFIALLLLRLLERNVDGEIPVSQIVQSLRRAQLVEISPEIYCAAYCDPVIKRIGKALVLDLWRKNYSKSGLRELAAATKR